ncbi:MAG: hypothetical protein N3E52_03750, partial [Candidatus Bathyarchaeota archaeon]|nr:hypothetical protein [Candidatus Bathyarchaeota archaeon]
ALSSMLFSLRYYDVCLHKLKSIYLLSAKAQLHRRFRLSYEKEKRVSTSVRQRFLSLTIKGAFFFEPMAPHAISYYLARRLREMVQEGWISDFHTRTRRLGKFHYKMEIDLDLTSKQAARVVDDLSLKE